MRRATTIFALLICGLAARADARTDNFHRPYRLGLAWSSNVGAEQWVGLRAYQLRGGMPGVWIDWKTSKWFGSAIGEWQSGNGGFNIQTGNGMYLVAGAGISVRSGIDEKDTGVNFHIGGLWTANSHIALLAGYDTRPGGLSTGLGWTF